MSGEATFWFGKARYRVLEGKEGVREAYDCMAGAYDWSKYFYWTRKMEVAEERVVKKWIGGFSWVCLDVGCGTGRHSLRIAEKGVEVVALDLSLKMLERLKAKKRGVHSRNLSREYMFSAENLLSLYSVSSSRNAPTNHSFVSLIIRISLRYCRFEPHPQGRYLPQNPSFFLYVYSVMMCSERLRSRESWKDFRFKWKILTFI